MIDQAIKNATEALLTINLTNQSLIGYVNEISTPVIKLKIHSCHLQAVERCTKLVREVFEKVRGLTKREVLIRTRLSSRRRMPSFETKGQ